ncbi:MAG: cholest-4-en-3-one 26-monooxygenase [Actinomycetota bacterium]
MQLSDIDLLNLDRFTEGVPHDWFTYLREHAPVYRHPEPGSPGFWVLTKHADVTLVGKDGRTFSSDQANGGVVPIEDISPANDADFGDAKLMLMTDPPEHTRKRKLVNHGFTPRMISRMEDHIRELTTELLDGTIAKGECDFVVEVAAELPLLVIAELIGVPVEDRHKIFEWSNRMVGSQDPEYLTDSDKVLEAQVEMFMYAGALAEERRKEPRDDIMTALLTAEVDGDRMSDMDFNLFFMLLSVAGNETTRNAISHGMHAFLENPDQYQALVDDPSLIDSATEEIVRWASPVMYFRRNATDDVEIRGQQIKAGDKLSIWYASANRDEEVFEDPFRFDIRRDPNPHIGFGGGGPHFCLGANLARMEIRVLFEELVRRVPRVESLGPADRLRSNFIAGIKHLPVRFHSTA